jgi:fatty acid desaturase/ferredoxin
LGLSGGPIDWCVSLVKFCDPRNEVIVLTEVAVDAGLTAERVPPASGPVVVHRGASDPGLTLPKIAIPTVCIWFGSLAVWLAATAVVLSDLSRWWLLVTIPAHALVTYAMFTVLHDSIHYSVGRPKWVSEFFGRLSMPFVALWTTYPVMRYVHIEHHRNTNEDPLSDPDAWAHAGPYWQLPFRWMTLDAWYSRFYLPRTRRRPRKEIVGLLINEALLVALLSALVGCGYGWDLLLVYLIPQRLALGVLAWWFDWLPHHGLSATAKIDTFRASRVRVGWERLMNPLMLYQNYHVVHHVYPRIPFYLWVTAWYRTEDDYLDRAVPIHTAWGRQLTHSEYRAWRQTARSQRANGQTGVGTVGEGSMRGQEELTGRPTQSEPEFADDAAVMLSTVVLRRGAVTEQTTAVGDESLLEAALRAGIDAPYSCIDGGCGVCRAKLLLGDVHVEQTDGLSASDVAEGWILTCQSRPATDVVHIAYDR